MSENFHPKWKYHADREPVIVYSKDDEEALGEGWHECPVDQAIPDDESVEILGVPEVVGGVKKRGRKPSGDKQ